MTFRMAVPNKGRLNARAVELITKAGIDLGDGWDRRLNITVDDLGMEVLFVRAQDIPAFVNAGAIDMGITGEDMVAESGYDIKKVLDLDFGRCRLSVCTPEDSGIGPENYPDGMTVATSFPRVSRNYFDSIGADVHIVTVQGAAEIMPYLGVSDVIVDLVATGGTLRSNHLEEKDIILKSQAAVFTSEKVLKDRDRKAQLDNLTDAIASVMAAEDRKYLMADVPRNILEEVQGMLPGIGGCTVLEIAGTDDFVAVQAVVSTGDMYRVVSELKRMGAKGILSLDMERLVE